jgi:hypothetical protein
MFARVEQRFARLEQMFARVEQRFARLEQWLNKKEKQSLLFKFNLFSLVVKLASKGRQLATL